MVRQEIVNGPMTSTRTGSRKLQKGMSSAGVGEKRGKTGRMEKPRGRVAWECLKEDRTRKMQKADGMKSKDPRRKWRGSSDY